MKFFVKTFAGDIDVFDVDVSLSQLEWIKAEIVEETNAAPEHCLFFPESNVWDGRKLSEHVFAFARARDRLALSTAHVAAGAAAAATPAGGAAAGEKTTTGAATTMGATGRDRRFGGYSSLSDGGWASPGIGNNSSGASDDDKPSGGVAARKSPSGAGKRSEHRKQDRGEVLVGVTRQETDLLSDHLKFRWVTKGTKLGWINIRTLEKNAPVPQMVHAAHTELPICLLFPGEVSQHRGMCRLVRELPGVADLMKRASNILGYDAMDLCTNGPNFRLTQTRYGQPLVFLAALSALEKLKVLRPQAAARASVMAGFGVGHFAALCVAGVLGFDDMLRLVQIRAEAMEEICNERKQLMLACFGLDESTLTGICCRAEQEAGARAMCRIAAYVPGGYSVGGTEQAVLLCKALAERAGASFVKVVNTQVASETQLMAPAGTKFFAALDAALPSMRPPSCTVWSSVGPKPFHAGCDPREIVEDLKAHLTKPCLWSPLMLELKPHCIGEFYELGPLSILKSMLLSMHQKLCCKVHSIEA